MKIVLVCAAGMSTSFVVQRMKKEAANRQLDVEVIAIPMEELTNRCKMPPLSSWDLRSVSALRI